MRAVIELENYGLSLFRDMDTWIQIQNVRIYTVFWDGVCILYLLAVYPRPRPWLPNPLTKPWPYVALGVAYCAVLATDPRRFIDFSPMLRYETADAANTAGVVLSQGWLTTVDNVVDTAIFVLAFVLLRDAFGERASLNWRSLALLAAGIPTTFMRNAIGAFWTFVRDGLGDPIGAVNVLNRWVTYGRIALVFAIVLIVALRALQLADERRRGAQGILAWFVAIVGVAALTAFVLRGPDWLATRIVLAGVFQLVAPILAAYALLRHQLIGADYKLKITVRRGTVVAVFLAVFVVAAQLAQNYLTDTQGYLVGGVAAGVLLFAIAPIQRAAERLSEHALPRTSQARAPDQHFEAYRSAVRLALMDGSITREEEKELAILAQQLAIGAADAWELREQVEGGSRGPTTTPS